MLRRVFPEGGEFLADVVMMFSISSLRVGLRAAGSENFVEAIVAGGDATLVVMLSFWSQSWDSPYVEFVVKH